MTIAPEGCSRLLVTLLLVAATTSGASSLHARQATPQIASSSVGHGAISGVVTDGATGRPLRGALVSLSDRKVKVSVGTITDSKGRFVFIDLPPSDGYTFRVIKSGYYGDGFISSGLSVLLPGTANAKLRLTDGQWLKNAVDIRLWPYGTVSGTVLDEQGEPVVGVSVDVLTQVPIAGSVQWVAGPRGTTDDRGFYRINRLQRGTYIVHVPNVQSSVPPSATPATVAGLTSAIAAQAAASSRPVPPPTGLDLGGAWLALGKYAIPPSSDGRHRAYPPLYYPASRSVASAVPVELGHGENKAGIDFVLQPVPTASVSGRVIGPPDALAGLVVRLLPGDRLVENERSEQATALVDANGAFSMVGVPAGNYTLAAATAIGEFNLGGGVGLPSTAGFVSSRASITVGSGPSLRTISSVGGLPHFGRTQVSVGSEDVTGVVLELKASATIGGRVVNEDGSPLRDTVFVSVSPVTGDPKLTLASARVAPDATFVLRGLQEGNYLLGTYLPVLKSISLPDGDYTERPFHVTPGVDIADIVITVSGRPATLSGVVRDRNGAAVSQSAVIIFPAERSQWNDFGLSPTRISSTTAFDGQGYTLSRLRAGHYLVFAVDASQSEAWQDSRFLEAAAAVATPITLNWGVASVQDLRLQRVIVR